ncbi:hypothetical protein MNB_SV-5-659 [hydrothermal vent metagenome]|uniref:Beta-lactamase n=1 Tax=hydrothermal vent metagenome TaxID=652676 RepID=A0A1W1EDE4_9ZZZZ
MFVEYLEKIKNIENIELYLILIIFIILLLLIFNTISYYYSKKRKIKNLHEFAKDGNIYAQSNLAKKYQKGSDVVKNQTKAAFWYQKAYFSGDEDAKIYLKKLLNR